MTWTVNLQSKERPVWNNQYSRTLFSLSFRQKYSRCKISQFLILPFKGPFDFTSGKSIPKQLGDWRDWKAYPQPIKLKTSLQMKVKFFDWKGFLQRISRSRSRASKLLVTDSLCTPLYAEVSSDRNYIRGVLRLLIQLKPPDQQQQQQALFAWPYRHIQYCKSYV